MESGKKKSRRVDLVAFKIWTKGIIALHATDTAHVVDNENLDNARHTFPG